MSAVMRPVVYQEAHPERARTYSSTAQAFRELPYCAAVQYWPSPKRMWRIVDAACFVLAVLVLTCPWWWPR